MPVYEIYKVGEDVHWQDGLDFFKPYGLSLAIIPHWNNAEGGAELDTGRCFMGETRFGELMARLPSEATVIGIDEHTALVMDFETAQGNVLGRGGVTVMRTGQEEHFEAGESFSLNALGAFRLPEPASGIPVAVWEEVLAVQSHVENARPYPPVDVMALVEERQAAHIRQDWPEADALRERIAALGWKVLDAPEGPRLEPQ